MTSKQRSAKQRKSRTSPAKTSARREAALAESEAARHTAYENKRVRANAEMDDDGAAPARHSGFMGDEFLMEMTLSLLSQHTGGGRLKIKSGVTASGGVGGQRAGQGKALPNHGEGGEKARIGQLAVWN